jgi:hypothetical protein
LKVAVAFVAFALLIRAGVGIMRLIATHPPPPPPTGELRKVDARFRCAVCGMEMKVVLAPDEDPEPPRHCMEEMALVRPDGGGE